MEQFLDKEWKDLRALFKSGVHVDDAGLEAILDLAPDAMQGIDSVSKEKLADAGIKTLYDLSQADVEAVAARDVDKTVLKKWVRKASIIVNYVQNPLTKKKLLLIGLDYAGKTSLLSVLKKDLSSINDLLPTKGASRDGVEFFGIPIITWDLGGQALYRKDYLDAKKSKLFFSETDVVFFIIDIQDEARFEEALNYYSDMLNIYKEILNEHPTIIVLFHKVDPDNQQIDELMARIAKLEVKIADISTEVDFAPTFATTSIYDKNSVFVAFSLGIRTISRTAKFINSLLEEYAVKTNAKAAVLMSSEGEVFAQNGVTREYIELVTQNGMLLDTMLRFNLIKGFNSESNPILRFSDNGVYLIGTEISSHLDRKVFLWLLVDNLADFTGMSAYFKKEVEPLLNLFII